MIPMEDWYVLSFNQTGVKRKCPSRDRGSGRAALCAEICLAGTKKFYMQKELQEKCLCRKLVSAKIDESKPLIPWFVSSLFGENRKDTIGHENSVYLPQQLCSGI